MTFSKIDVLAVLFGFEILHTVVGPELGGPFDVVAGPNMTKGLRVYERRKKE